MVGNSYKEMGKVSYILYLCIEYFYRLCFEYFLELNNLF